MPDLKPEIIERLGEHYGRTTPWCEWSTDHGMFRMAETYNDLLDHHSIVVQQTTRRGHWEAVGKKFRAGFDAAAELDFWNTRTEAPRAEATEDVREADPNCDMCSGKGWYADTVACECTQPSEAPLLEALEKIEKGLLSWARSLNGTMRREYLRVAGVARAAIAAHKDKS